MEINSQQNRKVVLDTEMVKIIDNGKEYQVLIKMSKGGVLEHEPFQKDLMGLVNALDLATQICAGKFFPRGVHEEKAAPKQEIGYLNRPK